MDSLDGCVMCYLDVTPFFFFLKLCSLHSRKALFMSGYDFKLFIVCKMEVCFCTYVCPAG